MTKKRRTILRICLHWGRDLGQVGRLPVGADVHAIGPKLVVSCSAECRAAEGLAERKH